MNNASVNFDLGDLFRRSWEVYKKNVGPLLGAVVVVSVILGFGSLALNLIVRMGPLGGLIIAGPLQLGLFKMVRQALRDEPVDFNLLFTGFSRFPDAYLAGLLIGIFSAIGAVFCIIPGIIVQICYAGTYLFMNEKSLSFWDAMEASRKMAMNNPGQWVILALVLFAFNLAGLLACGLGWLITAPMTYLIIAMAYDLEQNAVIDVSVEPVSPATPPSA